MVDRIVRVKGRSHCKSGAKETTLVRGGENEVPTAANLNGMLFFLARHHEFRQFVPLTLVDTLVWAHEAPYVRLEVCLS